MSDKPREFKIILGTGGRPELKDPEFRRGYDDQVFESEEEWNFYRGPQDLDLAIHVIEYAAYEKLKAKLAEVEVQRDNWREQHEFVCLKGLEDWRELHREREAARVMREALVDCMSAKDDREVERIVRIALAKADEIRGEK